eukprot:4538882-Amphidinium_carterae.1
MSAMCFEYLAARLLRGLHSEHECNQFQEWRAGEHKPKDSGNTQMQPRARPWCAAGSRPGGSHPGDMLVTSLSLSSGGSAQLGIHWHPAQWAEEPGRSALD